MRNMQNDSAYISLFLFQPRLWYCNGMPHNVRYRFSLRSRWLMVLIICSVTIITPNLAGCYVRYIRRVSLLVSWMVWPGVANMYSGIRIFERRWCDEIIEWHDSTFLNTYFTALTGAVRTVHFYRWKMTYCYTEMIAYFPLNLKPNLVKPLYRGHVY